MKPHICFIAGTKGGIGKSFAACQMAAAAEELGLTYAAFDSRRNVGKATREIQYKDSESPKFIMKESILNKMISDPHQHILYEYDFLNPKVFYLELMKVAQTQDDVEYPRCTHKAQELPKAIKNAHLPDPDELIEDLTKDDIFDDFEDGFNDEDQLDLGSIDDYGSY